MTMLVLVPLLLAFVWLCRFGARGFADDDPPPSPAAPRPADDVIGDGTDVPDWTALDDIQLNRLLKDSSP
jgi:hypothetical protein